jgi:hypothetical protein
MFRDHVIISLRPLTLTRPCSIEEYSRRLVTGYRGNCVILWTDPKLPSTCPSIPHLVESLTSRSLLSDRKRRLADKSIPSSLASDAAFAEESKMYQELVEMERRLDWQMQRKKVEIQDTLTRPASVRTPKVLYHRRLLQACHEFVA